MATMKYRYFCCGVVLTSLSWATLILMYSSHLEKIAKQEMREQRQRIREDMGIEPSDKRGKKNKKKEVPFPHVNFDDKVAWEIPIKKRTNVLGIEKNLVDEDKEEPRIMQRGDEEEDEMKVEFRRHGYEANDKQIPQKKVELAELGIVKDDEDQKKRNFGYDRFAFNLLVSDRIGERREIPDSRNRLCKAEVYPSDLPKSSIIICFYNEAPSVLIRMVNSILDRTPKMLLEEILLVDDYSDQGAAQTEIGQYATKNWPKLVKFLRTERREGLIRAKIFGAHHARGEIVLFLDSHCEVNQKWLEPLVTRIKEKPNVVVCPIIDIISPDTFKYVESPVCKGGFNWALFFKWDYPPWSYFKTEKDYIKPLKSPTMAGGLFAMRKDYFHRLGEYDPGMDVWGAENVEMSFRIWMCGGELEIIPCSRVGHIFRKRRPYGAADGSDTMGKNAMRTALVWLDEFKDKFFQKRGNKHDLSRDKAKVSERIKLRENLGCKSFRWYLENVYPSLLPGAKNEEGDVIAQAKEMVKNSVVGKYLISLSNTKYCLASEGAHTVKRSHLALSPCSEKSGKEVWHETELGELKLGNYLCLDSAKDARLMKCDMQQEFQEWKKTGKGRSNKLYNPASGLCIGALKQGKQLTVQTTVCNGQEEMLLWDFRELKRGHFDRQL